MSVTREQLFQRLDALGIKTTTIEHAAVFTVAESSNLREPMPGGHTKNLFLKDAKGRFFLVVAECHTEIDLKKLHKDIGCARLSFGKSDPMMEILGVAPGSVTAFGVINDRHRRLEQVIVDAALMGVDTIYCHPLANTATTAIARDDFLTFIRDCGHEPRIMPLEGERIS